MSIYQYAKPSPIDEVAFAKTANGALRAYLRAEANADASVLYDAVCKLKDKGWQCIPSLHKGNPALEVRGFKREGELLAFLDEGKWIQGTPKRTETPEEKHSFMDKLRKRSLQASGVFYFLGDGGFTTYGILESNLMKKRNPAHTQQKKQWENILAGLAYAAGTWSLVGFGRNEQSDLQIKDISRQLIAHLEKESVKTTPDCAITSVVEDKKKGWLESAHEFFRRYPSEMFCLFTGIAGIFVATAAARHHVLGKPRPGADAKEIRDMRSEGWADVGLGTITALSCAYGGLMQEKEHDPDDPQAVGLKRVWEWVREKPLRVTGYGLMVSTLCHAWSTFKAYTSAKRVGDNDRMRSVPFRAAFVGLNLIAEFLMSVSSKGHGEGVESDETVEASMKAIAADLIAKQKPYRREPLVEYMSKFLGRRDVLGGKDTEIASELRTLIAAQLKNPWTLAAPAQQQEAPSTVPSQEPQRWREHVTQTAPHHLASGPQLSTPA